MSEFEEQLSRKEYIGQKKWFFIRELKSNEMSKPRKAKECIECKYADVTGEKLQCTKGHKPRFYMPKYPYPYDCGGWRRRCEDYEEGNPTGINKVTIKL